MDSVTVTLTLTPKREDLFNVFVTALEGGIGYWSECHRYKWSLPNGEYDHDGFVAEIEETEADEPVRHTINRETIVRGLAHFAQPGTGYKHVRAAALALLTGNEADYDSEIADCIVQAGLFGEVVYG
jgi:hypothetical protein